MRRSPRHFFGMAAMFCLASGLLAACSLGQPETPVPAAPAAMPTLAADPLNENTPSAPPEPTPTPPPATTPSLAPTLQPSPTAAPTLRQLTVGGCCGQAFWSPDGSQVLYLDKPAPDAPVGIWGVSRQGGAPGLVTSRLGIYSADMQLLAYPEAGQTIVERLADGQRWVIPSQGRAVSFSTDGAWVAWTAGQAGPPFDTARREVWVSRSDGTDARLVQTVINGGFAAWLPDDRFLISGRLVDGEADSSIYLAAPDGSLQELARGERLRGLLLSPGGTWLAYQVTFSSDPAANGIWLVNTLSLQRTRLPAFGAFRWRDDDRLLLIPLDLTRPAHQVWQYSATEGAYQPLTDPAVTPFRIANGDWSVSPDGKTMAFLAAGDLNIWLMDLPE